jgi:hypothetical protein
MWFDQCTATVHAKQENILCWLNCIYRLCQKFENGQTDGFYHLLKHPTNYSCLVLLQMDYKIYENTFTENDGRYAIDMRLTQNSPYQKMEFKFNRVIYNNISDISPYQKFENGQTDGFYHLLKHPTNYSCLVLLQMDQQDVLLYL